MESPARTSIRAYVNGINKIMESGN